MTVSNSVAHNGNGASAPKPRVLVCASSASGHTMPMIKISQQLVERGYAVTFLAIAEFRPAIEKLGATYRELDTIEVADILRAMYQPGWTRRTLLISFVNVFAINPMAHHVERVNAILEEMAAEGPAEDIVVLTESMFVGNMPLFYGAPLPRGFTKRPKIINIHAMGYMISSKDLPPFGFGLSPGKTPEERAGHQAMIQSMITGDYKDVLDLFEREVVRLGGVDFPQLRRVLPTETMSVSNDLCLQLSPPSLEYVISDLHPKVKLIGTLPLRPSDKAFVPPPFWDEVLSGEKKVVVVTQGTVEQDYTRLLVPTLRALENMSDVLVVGILGTKDATLAEDVKIPANARIADYLSYDAILPHASAFVFNAGYGGFIHGVVNGVPMVFAGDTEEKPEVANRGDYAGVGLNLQTGDPSEEQIREAVGTLLSEPKYKKRVMEIKLENEALTAMDTIDEALQRHASL